MGFATIAVKFASLNFHLEISLMFFTKRQVFILFYVIFFILCNGFDLKVKSTTLDPPPSTLDMGPSTLDPRQRDRLLQRAESIVAPIKSSRSHRSLRCNYFLVILNLLIFLCQVQIWTWPPTKTITAKASFINPTKQKTTMRKKTSARYMTKTIKVLKVYFLKHNELKTQ